MKDRKNTESEIETFQCIGLALVIGSLAAFVNLLCSVFFEMDFWQLFWLYWALSLFALFVYWFFTDYSVFLREHAEEKKRIEKHAEEEKLKIEAEERIRAELQIWVSE